MVGLWKLRKKRVVRPIWFTIYFKSTSWALVKKERTHITNRAKQVGLTFQGLEPFISCYFYINGLFSSLLRGRFPIYNDFERSDLEYIYYRITKLIKLSLIHPYLHPLLRHWGWVTATCLALWLGWGGGIIPPLSTPSPAPLGLGDRHLPGLLVLVFYSILFYNLSIICGVGGDSA